MLQKYVLSVSGVSEVFCKCFYIDVAKVDRYVTYVAMVAHMLQMSITNLSSVFSDICRKCVYLDVA